MRIFLTGGTGLIGRRLIPQLLNAGHDVLCISRDAAGAGALLPPQVQIVDGDPRRPGPWQTEIADCDVVINLAGESVATGLWTRGKKRRIRRSRLAVTDNLVQALGGRERPALFLSSSAIGFYGDGGEQALDESGEPGQDFLARLALEWENTAREAESEAVRVVLLRTGIVLAPEGGAFPRMLSPFKMGLGGPLGSGHQYFPWIHIQDHVRIIMYIMDNDGIRGPVNSVVPNPPMQKDFAKGLGRALDKASWLSVPRLVLRAVLGEKADLLLTSQRALPNVLKAKGFRFEFGEMEAALQDLL